MKSVLIVGASARAAAESAVRAGFRVFTLDLFADRDLREIAETSKIEPSYPDSAVSLAGQRPATNWLFTGGIENHPVIIRQISQHHRLLGTRTKDITRARDFELLKQSVEQTSFRFPRRIDGARREMSSNEWLVKPLRSCGGTNVQFWTPHAEARDSILQQFVPGNSYSATFVADGIHSRFLGITRQWLAKDSSSYAMKSQESPFAYVGSTGPIPEIAASHDWPRLGDQLTTDFNLVGLFGVDIVITEKQEPYVIELNPRFTASMELIEQSLNQPMIQIHADACAGKLPKGALRPDADSIHGKAYLFAKEPWTFSRESSAAVDRLPPINQSRTRAADIPTIGTPFQRNEPVLTLFETGESHDEVQCKLGLTSESGWLQRVEHLLAHTK